MTRSRRPEVQAEIDLVLTRSPAQWLVDAGQLKAETLVYLARELLAKGEDRLMGKLVLDHIYKRVTPIAAGNCHGLSEAQTEEVIEKVLYLVNRELLWPKELVPLPYLEISFGHFVKRKTLNKARDARRQPNTVSLDEESVDHVPPIDPQEFERTKRELSMRLDIKMAIEKVLPRMKEEIRVAFEYWYYHDIPIQAKRPGEKSIEKLVARDKRTVHNWLKKVFAALEAELGEIS